MTGEHRRRPLEGLRPRAPRRPAAVLLASLLVAAACTSTPPAGNGASQAQSQPAQSQAAQSQATQSQAAQSQGAQSAAAFGADCPANKTQIGYDAISVTAWPLWIAKDTGALQKYNIDADVILTESGRTVPGVLNGQTPMSFMDGNDIFSPNVQGADLVAVMVTGNKPTDMIVGGRSTTDPQQLVGKAAGVNALTDETTAEMRYALEQAFKLPKDAVRIVSIGDESVRIAALASDQVQATVIDASEKDMIVAQGFHPLYNFLEGNLPWNKNVLMTTKKFASQNPKKVECLLMAMLEAGAYFKTNEKGSVDIAVKYSQGLARPDLETTWKTYASVYPAFPTVDPKGFQLQQQLNTDPGAKNVDLNSLVDNSYLQHLKDEGFLATLPQ